MSESRNFSEEYDDNDAKKGTELEVSVIKAAPDPRDAQTASSDLSSENQRLVTGTEEQLPEKENAQSQANVLDPDPNSSVDEHGQETEEIAASAEITEIAKQLVIDINTMTINTLEEARKIALRILEQLEEDLYEAEKQGLLENFHDSKDLNRHLRDPDKEKARRRLWLREHASKLSLVSNLSDIALDIDKPSTMNLFYEKGRNKHPHQRIPKLKKRLKVDESIQVDFHRQDILTSKKIMQNDFTQTREFALLRRDMGKQEYMRFYPKPDDWEEAPIPSRMNSLQEMLELANQHNPEDDLVKVGPKPSYKKSTKERLLKPIIGDCQKVEAYWTGSTYSGDFKDRMFEKGHYDYPTMAKYDSEFKEGHIHSKKHFGCVTYPRGDTFEGTWRKGRFTDGQITFSDGLKFEPMGWRYCTPPDRRFHVERSHGVQPVGETLYSNRIPSPHIPHGCYDVGDGVYNPETCLVISYDGILLRKVTQYEHRWIVLNCRKRKFLTECYEPNFMMERPPDLYAHSCPKNT